MSRVTALVVTQDLGIGMMLWMCHFFPDEPWARVQKKRCLAVLDRMWTADNFFCREPGLRNVKFAFTNYGVSVGLQASKVMPERVDRLNAFFESYRSGDEYDRRGHHACHGLQLTYARSTNQAGVILA